MMKPPYVIVGNALSAMIAAQSLAQRGEQVILVNGTPNWGGHFSTVRVGDLAYDAGMVLHEFTSFNASSETEDIATYDAYSRNDIGRFCQTVRHFVQRYQTTHTVKNIQMYVAGQYLPDLMISNQFEAMPQLPEADAMCHELRHLLTHDQKSPMHASRKAHDPLFMRENYEQISIANHGPTLHQRLIEPFCQKLLNVSTRSIVAYYHRVPWLPLFYPETLLSYLDGTPQTLAPTLFSYPDQGVIGDIAETLKSELLQTPGITLIPMHPTAIQMHVDGSSTLLFSELPAISTNKLAWSGALADLLKLSGEEDQWPIQEKASFGLVFATVKKNDLLRSVSVLSVVDPDFIAYRVTNQSACANADETDQRLVIELNYDYFTRQTGKSSPQELSEVIASELVRLGIVAMADHVKIQKVLSLKNALVIPNEHNLMTFEQQYNQVRKKYPNIKLLASASGFSSSSFNHQVLQGLKLNHDW